MYIKGMKTHEERMMSEGEISLELLSARVASLTDQVHDLKLEVADLKIRFTSLEARFSALETRFANFEQRFSIQEDRMSRMLAILVRLAERQGVPPEGRPQ
jgi:predicted nuclease with TOPRIM domain